MGEMKGRIPKQEFEIMNRAFILIQATVFKMTGMDWPMEGDGGILDRERKGENTNMLPIYQALLPSAMQIVLAKTSKEDLMSDEPWTSFYCPKCNGLNDSSGACKTKWCPTNK